MVYSVPSRSAKSLRAQISRTLLTTKVKIRKTSVFNNYLYKGHVKLN